MHGHNISHVLGKERNGEGGGGRGRGIGEGGGIIFFLKCFKIIEIFFYHNLGFKKVLFRN